MTRVDLQYPACFATTSTTDFDLAPGAQQISVFIPLNAQDFEVTMDDDSTADLVWSDADTQTEIVGSSSAVYGTSSGTYTYQGTTFTYTGRGMTSDIITLGT